MSITIQDQIYSWKEGFSSHYGVDAEVVIHEIEKIERTWGTCTPHLLVTAARDEKSPLHVLFNWDDQDAAERYRVSQARRVLSSLRIIVEESAEPVTAYVHVRVQKDDGHEDKYMEIHRAMAEAETRASVLREALRFLQGYRHRYAMLSELASVWTAIDEASDRLENRRVA